MRWFLIFLCLGSVAHAQVGTIKTPAQLVAETNSLFPDNTTNLITPFDLRQVSLDIIASTGSLAASSPGSWGSLQTFNGGLAGPCVSTTPPACDTPTTPSWSVDSKGRMYWTQFASSSLPLSTIAGTGFTLTGSPGQFPGIMHFAYSPGPGPNSGTGTDVFHAAHGAPGAETIMQAGDTLGAFSFRGWTGAGGFPANPLAAFRATVPSNWSAGNFPTAFEFYTIPTGGFTIGRAAGIYAGVVIGSGTTDPGAGSLLVGANINAAALPTAPVMGPGLGSVCVDTGGNFYRKLTCP